MKHDYNDIREAIEAKPQWWDECGVPRYCAPHPSEVNCIYASEVCFYTIKCQSCGYMFLVCSVHSFLNNGALHERLMDHGLHYGDPPNIGCCPAGPTMNSDPLEVVSFWSREKHEWKEIEELRGKSIRDD